MRTPRPIGGSRKLGGVRRTLILCVVGVIAGLGLVVTLVLSLSEADRVAVELATRVVPAKISLSKAASAATAGQAQFVSVVESQDPVARATSLSVAQEVGRAKDAAFSTYKQHTLNLPGERALQQTFEEQSARSVTAAATLIGMSPTDPTFATTFAEQRDAAEQASGTIALIQSKFYDPAVRDDADEIVAGIAGTRTTEYVMYGALAMMFGGLGLWLTRSANRDEKLLESEAVRMRATARRADLETSLQRALEMVPTEESSFDVIGQALTQVNPDTSAEMLLADSSQAHFRQVLSVAPGKDTECRVGSPGECPATLSGQTSVFEDSSQLDACPFLRGRDDAVWAVCVPVSIAGRTTGVIHTQGPVALPRPDTIREVELVGRKVGERLGMLRAFARSETQAGTDPLTGLLNRRSLEARTHDLGATGIPFVVAYGDLDHFKLLNDVHGHDAGDRALRLFARVLRDSVRPNDIPARYGGEEFVAVLPDCTLDNAIVVLDRIQANLRAAVVNGTVPPFTASFGLASSEPGLAFGEIVESADQALLQRKAHGA